MKIGVMGTGGVGGYFGGFLARAGMDIHFLARGKHLQALQEDGLEVVTNNENFRVRIHATSEPDDIGPVDLLLFCVKAHDTEQAARYVESLVEEDTVVLTLQNGIDNVDKLSHHFGEEKILGGHRLHRVHHRLAGGDRSFGTAGPDRFWRAGRGAHGAGGSDLGSFPKGGD
ncbi:2-dehydropantoate 2-reductase [Desulfacinum hydrothermale DSM 13146]|uniref:2-dehydropantoate 2-reductase n=1 Tax=Desulfacinum hydrothermale DSM 13146 TaxID=1121390 RepID=A0A1W1XB85_9BACT|nr:2-dehydropantoate 2-reductase [Desulfacinum hydrothermale]SMC21295.1 2-dehydropantoate 2-reductase [Desulfacinum hydrothermale DSM 13146]